MRTEQEYQKRKLPFVKREYGIANNGVFINVGEDLQKAQDMQLVVPEATVVYRSVSEWLEHGG